MVSCFLTSQKKEMKKCVIVNRQRHHKIRIGIVWAQTGHNKKNFATKKIEIESANQFQKLPKSFEFISGRMVLWLFVAILVIVVVVMVVVVDVMVVVVHMTCVFPYDIAMNAATWCDRKRGSQTPSVPATPEPSTIPMGLDVRMDGGQQMQKKYSENLFSELS